MKLSISFLPVVAIGAMMTLAPVSFAQSRDVNESTGTSDPSEPAHTHEQLVSANPLLILRDWPNMEYERCLSSHTTLGVAGSYVDLGDRYGAASVFVRYYPQGRVFRGWYVGGRTGASFIHDLDDDGFFFGAGVEFGYTWLLGKKENVYLGLGGGITRIFGGDLDGVNLIPQLRLVHIGLTF